MDTREKDDHMRLTTLLLIIAGLLTIGSFASAQELDGLETRYGSSVATQVDGLETRYGSDSTQPTTSTVRDPLEVRFGGDSSQPATAVVSGEASDGVLPILLVGLLALVIGVMGGIAADRAWAHRRAPSPAG
ncbi:MAG: hypothetical protein R3320_01075 [Nitriliruptorales bacterium]|nr:hypothetical protein [Nitriliruptorales bacterium]